MSQSSIGFAFEELGEKEMAASQNASSSSFGIITYYSLTGTCLPSITVTVCQTTTLPITITVTTTTLN